eukprot:snap_masked-scaffold_3-processed-gene-16.39-mRNA-1 protein AED:1.00 eAED:1.00 QI:0/-1/0/0/-1/1/1/0/79
MIINNKLDHLALGQDVKKYVFHFVTIRNYSKYGAYGPTGFYYPTITEPDGLLIGIFIRFITKIFIYEPLNPGPYGSFYH